MIAGAKKGNGRIMPRWMFSLVISLALGVMAVACGDGSSNVAPATAPPSATQPGVPPSASTQPAVIRAVEGNGDPRAAWKFDPAQVTIRLGDTVSFANAGKEAHTATADDGSFDAGTLNPGETKPVTFDRQGSFAYHCSLHPWMKGTIVVTAAAAGTDNNASSY